MTDAPAAFVTRRALLALGLMAALPAGLLPTLARAQQGMPPIPPVRYPSLPATAADAAGFTPQGWALEASVKGDLNQDGREDLVMVFHGQDPALVLENRGLGERRLDTNPRILAIAFAQPDGGYRLVAQDQSLIRRRTVPVFEDPFGPRALEVARGTFRIRLGLWSSAGSYHTEQRHFTFRWQDGAFALIGLDVNSVQRSTGETQEVSINYSTGRASITDGRIDSDAEKKRWVNLQRRPLAKLGEVGDGLDFRLGVPGLD